MNKTSSISKEEQNPKEEQKSLQSELEDFLVNWGPYGNKHIKVDFEAWAKDIIDQLMRGRKISRILHYIIIASVSDSFDDQSFRANMVHDEVKQDFALILEKCLSKYKKGVDRIEA